MNINFFLYLQLTVLPIALSAARELSDLTYYDRSSQKMLYKIWSGSEFDFIPWKVFDSSIPCPANSHVESRTDKYSRELDVVVCKCDNGFTPHNNWKTCVPGRDINESCDGTRPCLSSSGLRCLYETGTCQCSYEHDEGVWDEQDKVCYSSSLCNDFIAESKVYNPNSTNKCVIGVESFCDPMIRDGEDGSCPANAVCIDQYANYGLKPLTLCQCKKGYAPSRDNLKCIKISGFGESCTSPEVTCTGVLSCMNGVCTCPDNLIWSSGNRECSDGAGDECLQDSCVSNAKCDSPHRSASRRCICESGYRKTEDKLCRGEYLSNCRVQADCLQHLSCIDNFCKCPDPMNQLFDGMLSSGECRTLADSKCDSSTTCVINSRCDSGKCKCVQGYSTSWKGECLKSLGEECLGSEQRQKCNINQGLACINGSCACVDPGLSFVNGTGCVGTLGSRCGSLVEVGKCNNETVGEVCDKYFVSCPNSTKCNSYGRCELA